MATCDVHLDPALLSDEDFLALMHDKLPPYVVKCMLAAGFDVVEVVTSMDLSDKPGNSINIIEKFINQHFSGNNEYTLSLKPFVFPPGHRIRLCTFLSDIQRQVETTKKAALKVSDLRLKILRH